MVDTISQETPKMMGAEEMQRMQKEWAQPTHWQCSNLESTSTVNGGPMQSKLFGSSSKVESDQDKEDDCWSGFLFHALPTHKKVVIVWCRAQRLNLAQLIVRAKSVCDVER